MNILEVQTVFERAAPEKAKSDFRFTILVGTLILIGAIIIMDYRKMEKSRNESN